MTDGPALTPEQEAVRRLLAEARHQGATPPEVVARLDDTLASLVAERGLGPLADEERPPERAAAPVVDLGARRRRRVGVGLLAAAAVVVAGVALGQGLPLPSGSNDSSSADGGADSATSRADSPDASSSGGDDAGAAEASPEDLKSAAPEPGVPTLSSTDPALDS